LIDVSVSKLEATCVKNYSLGQKLATLSVVFFRKRQTDNDDRT